jgi:predicted DCC family thiol-disulfide oxidoreductase YuxK
MIANVATGPDLLFYDGGCGLCHRTVRFVIAHDPDGHAFRFAPLGGPTFLATIPAPRRAALPDSIVVRTADGRILDRSAAVLHIGQRLGGPWARAAELGWLVPRWVADPAYDLVARVRKRLFPTPTDTCPVLGEELRARFDE